MSLRGRRRAPPPKQSGKGTAVITVAFKRLPAPRLRFDRTAIGLIERLQTALATVVTEGKTVIVAITAPIRQDSKTGALVEAKVRELLARRRVHLKTKIHGNGIQIRVLEGGVRRTPRLIGFVHNPQPPPAALFDVADRLLACLDLAAGKLSSGHNRCLIVDNQQGRAPLDTIRRVCTALQVRTVFKRILVSTSDGLETL